MATIMITRSLRSLVSRSPVARVSAGATTVLGADAAAADAFSVLGQRGLVPSGMRALVYRRSVAAMGLNDKKKSVLLIAGSRYAVK